MKLSTKTRYAARALGELAGAYADRNPMSIKQMAERQGLSEKYLEQIIAPLKEAGLVESVRGVHGGYRLARRPASITLGDIFRVLEGSPAPVHCVDNPYVCPRYYGCPTRPTWVALKDAVEGVLDGTTLEDLADRMSPEPVGAVGMYHI